MAEGRQFPVTVIAALPKAFGYRDNRSGEPEDAAAVARCINLTFRRMIPLQQRMIIECKGLIGPPALQNRRGQPIQAHRWSRSSNAN
jgi:hypothetical protein